MGRILLSFLVILVAVWTGGLVIFSAFIPDKVVDTDSATDAIVVLTGGDNRVATGIELLKEGNAKRLFVSGVHEDVLLNELVMAARQQNPDLSCCIELGYQAHNTHQNAREVVTWVKANNINSIRLVTSNYHLPRSLLEIRHQYPNLAIVPHPAFGDKDSVKHLRLMVLEYTKFLITYLTL